MAGADNDAGTFLSGLCKSGNIFILAAQQTVFPLDLGYLSPQSGKGLTQLAADRAAAENDHPFRNIIELGELFP